MSSHAAAVALLTRDRDKSERREREEIRAEQKDSFEPSPTLNSGVRVDRSSKIITVFQRPDSGDWALPPAASVSAALRKPRQPSEPQSKQTTIVK